MKKEVLSEKVRNIADSIGIDALGFAEASNFAGYALSHSRRRDPKLSLPDAKSIIVAGIYIGGVTLPSWTNPWYGRTSRLYLSEFFLDVVKPIEPIVDFLKNEGYQAIVCEGSKKGGSILPLKLAAIRAGLGWQGKHSLLISKKYGTFLALGGIITNADLEHNTKEEPNRCHKCDKCQKACPLAAIDHPYVLNKSKCLSNLLQVEQLPEEAQVAMENRIGDCEICQEACPWNAKHLKHPLVTKMTGHFQKKIKDWGDSFYLSNLYEISKENYKNKFGHLNTDIPYHLFRRNILIAMENAERVSKKITFEVSLEDDIETAEVIELYKANSWSSAEKPEKLMPALKNSDALVTARISGKLVGIGNAISDGSLVVYYPHMLVHPDHKGKGIGRAMMELLKQKYASFHQQMLNADKDAIGFYKVMGFERAGKTEPMWVYAGNEH